MAEPNAATKPTRVIEGQVDLVGCPVCKQTIMASVVGEVRLGDLGIGHGARRGETFDLVVTAEAQTRIRSLTVEHTCDPHHVRQAEALAERDLEADLETVGMSTDPADHELGKGEGAQ